MNEDVVIVKPISAQNRKDAEDKWRDTWSYFWNGISYDEYLQKIFNEQPFSD